MRKRLAGYGTWKYSRKPLDRNGLTKIAYIPKTKYPNPFWECINQKEATVKSVKRIGLNQTKEVDKGIF